MPGIPNLLVFVYTGDRKYAGTDNTVHIVLNCVDGKSSKEITLNNAFRDDFERGRIDCFRVPEDDVDELDRFMKVQNLQIWKDFTLGVFSSDWFVDKIVVENCATNTSFVFPFFRWIKSGYRYNIQHFDTSLPQNELFPDQRKKELEGKRRTYEFDQKIPNGPVQVKKLPEDEQFSFDYKWDLFKTQLSAMATIKFKNCGINSWKTMNDIQGMYNDSVFQKPKSVDRWDCDINFGRKRLTGVNPILIELFTDVPQNFPVTDELLADFLEGMTLKHAIKKKKLFCCDLKILEGLPTKTGTTLCNPIALFFVNKEKQLVPVAIQLFQKHAADNPIFTPSDDYWTWNFVKMWYNNADSVYHQALIHLGFTHTLMEGVAIASHRNLSPSHPIFKILAPHFLYIIAINDRALGSLVSPGGWVDRTMACGSKGLLALTVKGFGNWRMDLNGTIPELMKRRGVDDPDVLPGYYFRDDATLVFNAILKYVKSYVEIYYTCDEVIIGDHEIQGWAAELVKPRNKSEGGAGLLGVPGEGSIRCKDCLARIVTSIIYVCSAAHASANFGQYDEYAYMPSSPSLLKGNPPTSKDTKLTEKEIVNSLVDKKMALDILTVTKILSRKGTNSLGDFEVDYIFDPKAKMVVQQFREDLKEIGEKIDRRNENLEVPYNDLHPDCIPNSISI